MRDLIQRHVKHEISLTETNYNIQANQLVVNHLSKIKVKNALAKMRQNRLGPNDIYGYLGVHGQNWLDWLIKLFK